MTTVAESITGGKLPGLSVESLRVGNTVQYAATAAGTTNADALAINAGVSRVIVATAAASTGIRLPVANRGDVIEIANGGANAIVVYPGTGARVNGLTVTTVGVTIAAGAGRRFIRVNDSATEWFSA